MYKLKGIIGVFFILCILISSCAVKYGIKNIFDVQPSSARHSPVPKDKFITSNSSSQCHFCKEKEIIAKSDTPFAVSDFGELAAVTFILFVGAFLSVNIRKHPQYSSSKIGNSVPIFIRYRKLII